MWKYLLAAALVTLTLAGDLAAGDLQEIPSLDPQARFKGDPLESADAKVTLDEAQATLGAQTSFCTRSARAALRACGHEVEDDFWIAIGNCLNLSDEDEREECMEEAHADRTEARELCGEQLEVREEVCDLLGEDPYDPEIDPDDFLEPEEAAADPHPYFPLVPGTMWFYEGGDETIEVTVTDATVEILGVTCFVVKDIVRENGVVIEDTDDWYAQDEDGNIWYFGELTLTFEDGVLASLDGSWKAGVDGGKAGMIMPASPQVDDAYRQEFLLGDVEDLAQVLSITGSESVPGASCHKDCAVTRDFTPIEPGQEEHKHYAPGVGLMLEVNPDTGERVELVNFVPGNAPAANSSDQPNLRTAVRSHLSSSSSRSRVEFDLRREAVVSADVYDSGGRRVRSLVNGPYGSGHHTVEWDGMSESNSRVAPGIYFLRVRAGDEARSEKVLVVR